MTLVELLDRAAKRIDCCDGGDCKAYDGKQCESHHLAVELRARAARVRELMERAALGLSNAQQGGDESSERMWYAIMTAQGQLTGPIASPGSETPVTKEP